MPFTICSYRELLFIMILVCLFFFLFRIHKVIIPKGYFSIYEVTYFFDLKRFWSATNIRYFSIGCIIILMYSLGYQKKIDYYLALGIVGVMQIYPPISNYKLYSFWGKYTKLKLLFAYFFYLFTLLCMGFACLEFVIPSFYGQKGFFDSKYPGVNFMLGAFVYIAPILIDYSIVAKRVLVDESRIEFLHIDTIIMLRNLKLLEIDKSGVCFNYLKDIENFAQHYEVPVELLKSVILIEEFNRGSCFQKLVERILIYCCPEEVKKKDMSIGIAQIKISTASKLLGISKGRALQILINPRLNIKICAHYLRDIIKEYENLSKKNLQARRPLNGPSDRIVYRIDQYDHIAKRYVGADDYADYTSLLYASLLRTRCSIPKK